MRPIRHVRPGCVYEITTQTIDRTKLLRPSKEVNRIILGVIGRAQEQSGVKIYALVFMSTHYHMLIGCADAEEKSSFVGMVNCNITKKLNDLNNRSACATKCLARTKGARTRGARTRGGTYERGTYDGRDGRRCAIGRHQRQHDPRRQIGAAAGPTATSRRPATGQTAPSKSQPTASPHSRSTAQVRSWCPPGAWPSLRRRPLSCSPRQTTCPSRRPAVRPHRRA